MSQKITIDAMSNNPNMMIEALVEDSMMSTKINISTTALKKCGLIGGVADCDPPSDLISLCVSYLSIDEKQTKAEMFDSLCKRLEEHFKINTVDTPLT